MNIDYRHRPALTNDVLGNLLDPDRSPEVRLNYQQVLSRSLTWIGAFQNEALVGYANVAWDGGIHAFLLDPTVRPDFRLRGIGTRLMRETMAAVAAFPELEWLHVDASKELMERFYIPAGFRATAAGVVWVKDSRRIESS